MKYCKLNIKKHKGLNNDVCASAHRRNYTTPARETRPDAIIAIDPDIEQNGVAFLDCSSRRLEVSSLSFPDTLDYLRYAQRQAQIRQHSYIVYIEAGWLNKAHWHLSPRDSRQKAAAIGNQVGRNHEVGRKLFEMCQHWGIPCELVKPLALRSGGVHLWSGKDGKITHEELAAFTGIVGHTNQEGRDAALIAWYKAGFEVVLGKKR